MSESIQRQTGNKVVGSSRQITDAANATQIVESSEIGGSLTQEALSTKKDNIDDVLKQVLAAIERLGLNADEQDELKVHAGTAESQLKLKKPNPAIITESLKSIWETLKGAAASAAASGAALLAKELLDKIAVLLT